MYKYTTPTLPVTISDINFLDVDYFRIAIKAGKKYIFEIPANDERVDSENNTIYLELTQEQTAHFAAGYAIIQARIKYNTGRIQATETAKISINDVIDEVII